MMGLNRNVLVSGMILGLILLGLASLPVTWAMPEQGNLLQTVPTRTPTLQATNTKSPTSAPNPTDAPPNTDIPPAPSATPMSSEPTATGTPLATAMPTATPTVGDSPTPTETPSAEATSDPLAPTSTLSSGAATSDGSEVAASATPTPTPTTAPTVTLSGDGGTEEPKLTSTPTVEQSAPDDQVATPVASGADTSAPSSDTANAEGRGSGVDLFLLVGILLVVMGGVALVVSRRS